MTDESTRPASRPGAKRIFLVVVDESAEMEVALRYACYRARNSGGRVALLYVIEPGDFQHFMAVEDIVREEQRAEAEQILQRHARVVNQLTGTLPSLYLGEGVLRDELLRLVADEPWISVLVLAAGTGPEGPGPLISYLAGKGIGRLRVPLTIVPGKLTEEQLLAVT